MRSRLVIVGIGVVLSTGMLTGQVGSVKKEASELSVHIKLEKNIIDVGAKVPIEIKVTNNGTNNLVIESPDGFERSELYFVRRLQIVSPAGEKLECNLPIYEPSPQLRAPDENGVGQPVVEVVCLGTNETMIVKVGDLSKYFNLLKKGKYSVTLVMGTGIYRGVIVERQRGSVGLAKTKHREKTVTVVSNTELLLVR